jgi:phytanoyl-CoA hydroxylase
MDTAFPDDIARLSDEEIVRFHRDGFIHVPGLIGPKLVAAALDDLVGLAEGKITPSHGAHMALEPVIVDAGAPPAEAERVDLIRKFMDFVDDSPALRRIAMNRRLHALLDQLYGPGRVLFQEMALVKPPKIGSEKRWHQDAAYFRVSDPTQIAGLWVALDRADAGNGCMELVPGSHLAGPAVHVPMADVNQCHIRPDKVDVAKKVQVEMDPGDALIFSALVHHYTAPNTSGRRRRAVQYHFHQDGLEWTGLDTHVRQFHDEGGAYAACTVQPPPVPPGREYTYRAGLIREIVPMGDLA